MLFSALSHLEYFQYFKYFKFHNLIYAEYIVTCDTEKRKNTQ
jgi:hypothetical protein